MPSRDAIEMSRLPYRYRSPRETAEILALCSQISTSFPFMRLPLEMRIEVYKLYFEKDEENWYGLPTFPLLIACKTTYNEALPFFMRASPLKFTEAGLMGDCLGRMPSFQRQFITHIYFSFTGTNARSAFQTLQGCIRLKLLTIDLTWSGAPLVRKRRNGLELLDCKGVLELLQLRGLTTVELVFDNKGPFFDDMEEFLEALKVLNEPFNARTAAKGVSARRKAAAQGLRKDFLPPGVSPGRRRANPHSTANFSPDIGIDE